MKRTIWKRGCSLLFTLILVIGLIPVTALADGVTGPIPDGLQLNGTIVTGYTGTDTELEIPEGVTEIGSSAFLNSTVQEVKLPSTLTTIGEYAFQNSALTSITIPESVTTIGKYAFTQTDDLVSATILGNPTLGEGVFWSSGIQSIEMNRVTAISYLCFAQSSLTSISMDSVKSIGESAFRNTKLTEFAVPDTVESIGAYFLDDIDDLTTLTVSLATLQKTGIHKNAFANISSGCDVVLTDVSTDITLLDGGFSFGDATYTFRNFSVTTVQNPSDCTITNQTGGNVSIVVGGETITVANGNAKPVGSAASSDAYLESLTVTADSSPLTLEPSFSNPVTNYTSSVSNNITSVSIIANPSHATATVSINGQTADDYTVDVELAVGENPISIVVTAPDGTTQKTYTVTVTRNEAVPQHLTISTADELMDFADKVNNGPYQGKVTADMLVELTADIDMSGYTWTPIDFVDDLLFFGTFDGNDHTISGLTIYNVGDAANFGLFGSTACTIRDVHVSGEFVDKADGSSNYWFGSIAAYTEGDVISCTAEFTVHGEDDKLRGQVIGGVVGYIYHAPDDTPLTMENCVSYTTITGTVGAGFVGGVAGVIANTETINCRNYGTLSISQTGYVYAGGITGQTQTGAVLDHCINYGNITHTTANNMSLIGGICGRVSTASQLICCTNNGDLDTMASGAGGIVGATYYGGLNTVIKITQCLNNGAVSSEHSSANVAGLIAAIGSDSYVEVTANISLGQLSAESNYATIHPVNGSLSSATTATFSSNYYNSSLTTQGNIAQAVTDGSTGLALTQLKTQETLDAVNAAGGNFRLDADGNIQVIPLSYALTVENSYAAVTGAGQHEEGEQVTIDAGTRPGYRFAGWTTTSGTITNPSASRTTFTMPDEDATVTASWEYVPITTYPITVKDAENGTVTCYAHGAAKDAVVTLRVKADVGYQLDKLTVTDANGNTRAVTKVDEKTYTFVMPACAVTVEALFAPITSGLPFTDVNTGDWFYEAVQFVYENGLMDGVEGNRFAPNATLTRAMAVTILYRLEGEPAVTTDASFNDVASGQWYTDAVNWAAANNIINGVEGNNFDPTGSLTREQMATILYRYTQYKGADVSASGDISGFVDSANVSSWAADAVKWAVGSGLVNGVEGNALAPQGTSTRAQAATVLMRFVG